MTTAAPKLRQSPNLNADPPAQGVNIAGRMTLGPDRETDWALMFLRNKMRYGRLSVIELSLI